MSTISEAASFITSRLKKPISLQEIREARRSARTIRNSQWRNWNQEDAKSRIQSQQGVTGPAATRSLSVESRVCPLESFVCPLESELCPLESEVCPPESDVCTLESGVCQQELKPFGRYEIRRLFPRIRNISAGMRSVSIGIRRVSCEIEYGGGWGGGAVGLRESAENWKMSAGIMRVSDGTM